MGLVDDQEEVLGKVVQQAGGAFPRLAPARVAAVVLDAGTGPHLQHHLEVEVGARLDPLRLQKQSRRLESLHLRRHLLADQRCHLLDRAAPGHVVRRRIDRGPPQRGDRLAGERVEARDPLDLVAPQLDPDRLLLVRGKHFDRIAAHAEGAALERDVVALVQDVHQAAQNLLAWDLFADFEVEHQSAVVDRVAQSVDARHRCHDDHVPALDQRRRGAQPQPLDVLVDRRVLLDVRVRRGDVGLGLVVVVIRDEVLDGVGGKERLEFAVELGGQRLVVRHDQGGPLRLGNHVGHGERLARSRRAQQRLEARAGAQSLDELDDGSGLVALRLEGGLDLELRHRRVRSRGCSRAARPIPRP